MQKPLPARAEDPEANQRIVSMLPTVLALILSLRGLKGADGAWPESQTHHAVVTKPALLPSTSLPLGSCLCLITQARVGKEPWLKEKILPFRA